MYSAQGDHFVLAGIAGDVPVLNRLLTVLPEDGYGQVFLESTGPLLLRGWPGPVGIVPLSVRQDLAPASGGRLPGPGEVLADALRAWAAEWLPPAGHLDPLPYTMWIGGVGYPPIDQLCAELTRDYPWLHLHHASMVPSSDG